MANSSSKENTQPPEGAYTVKQFCETHGGISKAFFYKLKKCGAAPRTYRLGTRFFVSIEAAAEWRRRKEEEEMEQESSTIVA
jgi:predicted DNA-binding transcriptional regulator AlpA